MTTHSLDRAIAQVTCADGDVSWIDLGVDTAAAEQIGVAVAEATRAHDVDLVLSWDDENDSVLAHVAAHTLGVHRIVVQEDMGLLTLSRPVQGGVAVLVAVRLTGRRSVGTVRSMLEGYGIRLALAIEVIAAAGERDAPWSEADGAAPTPRLALTGPVRSRASAKAR